MSLIGVALVIILVGVLLWAVQAFLGDMMHPKILLLLQVVVVLVLVFWLLQVFGVIGPIGNVHLR